MRDKQATPKTGPRRGRRFLWLGTPWNVGELLLRRPKNRDRQVIDIRPHLRERALREVAQAAPTGGDVA